MRQLIVLVALAGCSAANAAALKPNQVFDKVKDSVVVVKTFNAKGENITLGSGVLLPSGKIGTNCHVVENGTSFQVGGGKKFMSATLWGGDEDKDICLLEARGLTAKPAQLGQATRLKVGEAVYAVGAPQGLELSLSNGIVSQLRGGPPPFIQTTAAISHGSSGGGLFDEEGRLVGFTTLYIDGGQSLNFAMPVEWVAEIRAEKKVAQGRSEGDWLKRAIALTDSGNWAGLRDWGLKWTREQPKSFLAWYYLGEANRWLQHHAKSIAAYSQAVRIAPDNGTVWFLLGSEYGELQRHTEAIDAYRKAVRINPDDAGSWYDMGFHYDELKRYTEAIEAYRQTLRINGDWQIAWNNLGGVYFHLKRYPEAIAAFRQILRIDPADAKAWYNLGLTHYRSGNHTAALEAVQQLRPLDPAKADELFNLIVPR